MAGLGILLRLRGLSRRTKIVLLVAIVIFLTLIIGVSVGVTKKNKNSNRIARFEDNYNITWAPDHFSMVNGGELVDIMLDKVSGAGFGSINKYLFGNISMQLKLVANDSAGTVTAYYLSSLTDTRDEFDFEFLGNTSGQPYILQTNVYVNGVGGREQRIFLWFDPTADFHTYSVLWNQHQAIFNVDNVPIRVFRNNTALGVPYAYNQGVGIFSSIWNGDQWATRGGLEKINWTYSPFTASYQGFGVDGCIYTGTADSCLTGKNWWDQDQYQTLTSDQLSKLSWVKQNFTVYNYCTDFARYKPPLPECGSDP
ncbi:hypothetical protein O6H91_07G127500 [Diphasiastrum complanatum]|uniref:Uncharacterized protein n=1 Tax=Diphasiastrum complanatum TaxID=34168 RepID=A0ACC2D9L7_DIPCM|nr:hypothetical protein O6H91_07G127500 [Diphasiastrum complanatum]